MSTRFSFPDSKAVVCWPVGTGDSTTLILKPGHLLMQIDLRHLKKADDAVNPEWPIIDYLVQLLPRENNRPYLAAFVLTHPDRDHVQGFAELLRKVHIGELWHTPRIFRDQADQETLCEDAIAFRKEAHRRRRAIANSPDHVESGDRLRVIGHDDILNEDEYQHLPEECKSRPGDLVETVDGVNLVNEFSAFIHAPFKDDQAKDKNNTSLSLNVVLWEGERFGQFMFFGDREYPTIKRIYETTETHADHIPYLYWDVMLAAHHCSKAVMYWQGDEDEAPSFRQDIMDFFERYARSGYVVASALSEFTDGDGDDPPHGKARKRYEAIVKAGRFLCTHEYPSNEAPVPLVFTIASDGFRFDDEREKGEGPTGLAAAIEAARGATKPPSTQTTFGRR